MLGHQSIMLPTGDVSSALAWIPQLPFPVKGWQSDWEHGFGSQIA